MHIHFRVRTFLKGQVRVHQFFFAGDAINAVPYQGVYAAEV